MFLGLKGGFEFDFAIISNIWLVAVFDIFIGEKGKVFFTFIFIFDKPP